MALKTLLVAFTTFRTVDGTKKRVRFAAKSVVDLTADEEATLQKLQDATGKLHFRDPVNEGGKVRESDPEVVDTGDADGGYDESDRAMGDKTVKGLKAYLDHHEVEYESSDDKAALLAKAQAHASGATGGDQDEGL